MALPVSRDQFKEYCLRRLGKPVIDINVDNSQIDDRIEEALQYYQEYHFDGARKVYVSHPITAADKTNRYITLPEEMFSVVNVFDIGDSTSTNNLFNIRYQLSLNDIFDTAHFRMDGYYLVMRHISFLEEILVGKVPIRFNQHTDRVFLDMDWAKVVTGEFIIIEGYERMDPDTWPDIWSDRWLIRYTTALFKKQWGLNLKKYDGMQLPGGITFSGQTIYQEAEEEIGKLEEEMMSSFSLPVADMMG